MSEITHYLQYLYATLDEMNYQIYNLDPINNIFDEERFYTLDYDIYQIEQEIADQENVAQEIPDQENVAHENAIQEIVEQD